MQQDLAAFVVLTFILAVTPGASTAMVLRNVIAHGRRAGYRAAAGAAAGNITWAVVAAVCLAVSSHVSPRSSTRFDWAEQYTWRSQASVMSWMPLHRAARQHMPEVGPAQRPSRRAATRSRRDC